MLHYIVRFLLVLMIALTFATAGCEREGPAERAGEEIDETVEELGDAVEEGTD